MRVQMSVCHHSGLIISDKTLVDNKEARESIKANAPEAIGGEMEGVVLIEKQQIYSRGKRVAPRDFGVANSWIASMKTATIRIIYVTPLLPPILA